MIGIVGNIIAALASHMEQDYHTEHAGLLPSAGTHSDPVAHHIAVVYAGHHPAGVARLRVVQNTYNYLTVRYSTKTLLASIMR